MDIRVLNQKLESLRNCVSRIETKIPSTAETLISDFDIQDIISLNIERAVQVSLDIAAHIGSDFDDIREFSAAGTFLDLAKHKVISDDLGQRLARTAGFRNLLVHRYASIDWSRVFLFITRDLGVFRDFAREIDSFSTRT
jgi:uncharacterized protein YutE (UPF0331/DUF86 family)